MDPNRSTFSFMGTTVEMSNDYAFVAATESSYDTAGVNPIGQSGIVLVYKKSPNGRWNLHQKLQSSSRNNVGQFGWSMAAEDSLLIVGARGEWVGFQAGGAAHVFELQSNGRWEHQQRLIPTDTAFQGRFGESVAISWPHIVVGAEKNDLDSTDGNALYDAGAAYVYEKIGGSWQQTDKLSASQGRVSTAYFGKDVAIHGDRILVGAPEAWLAKPSGGYLYAFGLVYEYARQPNGEWDEVYMLIDTLGPSIGGYFGDKIEMTDSLAFIGARTRFVDTTIGAGQVVVMKRSNLGWVAIQYLEAIYPYTNDNFGSSIDYDNGNLIVGVPGQDHELNYQNPITSAGAAYWFKTATNSDSLYAVQKILPQDRILPNSTFDFFGSDVAIDNGYLLVGARNDDDDTANAVQTNAAGTAYFFDTICTPKTGALSTDICFGDSLFFNGQYLNLSGNYTEILTASDGCDSIVTLSLGVLSLPQASISVSSCNSYTSPSGSINTSVSGTFIDTLTATSGCDSILSLSVTIKTADTAVVLDQSNQRLIALATNASFRWLDCENSYAVIPGIINDTAGFVPGTYAVEITQNGCVDTSRCVVLRNTYIIETGSTQSFSIYPNPVRETLSIRYGPKLRIRELRILTTTGKVVEIHHNIKSGSDIHLALPSGQYVAVAVTVGEGFITRKFTVLNTP